jgi:molecular chaperone GrpE
MTSRDDTDARPVIRDRRRIDPVTGNVREPVQHDGPDDAAPAHEQGRHVPRHTATEQDAAAAARLAELTAQLAELSAQLAELGAQLKERTADVQRVQAEYANYRKRVERDRVAVREQALANVIVELLPVLDNIGRAREHGELSGGFKSVAESIEAAAAKLGLVRYGEHGEPFDPNVHEALMHSYSSEVTEPTCVQILQPGYKVGGRILRPARVAVAEPGGEYAEEPSGEALDVPPDERLGPAQQEQETPQDRGS